MPSALLLAAGSRGDTEPLISLAVSLLAEGTFDLAHICLQPDYFHLVPQRPDLVPHEMPFTIEDIPRVFIPRLFKHSFVSCFPRRKMDSLQLQNVKIAQTLKYLVIPALPTLAQIASEAQPSLILTTGIPAIAAQTISEQLRVPMAVVNTQPVLPTTAHPCIMTNMESALQAADKIADMHEGSPADDPLYLGTYEANDEILYKPSVQRLNDFRSSLNLAPLSLEDIHHIFSGASRNIHYLNAYPSELVPHCPSWPATVHDIPPLATDYVPPDWDPHEHCPKVVEYLAHGEKPLCVNFGSVNLIDKQKQVSKALMAGLRATGVDRVLLLTGRTDLGPHKLSAREKELRAWADEHVFVSEESPQFAWLFPQCAGLVCHGGAGTIFAAMRVGLPLVVAPTNCDQFFWARLVEEMGLGGVAEPNLRDAREDAYVTALTVALGDDAMKRASAVGERLRSRGNGAKIAAELLGALLPNG